MSYLMCDLVRLAASKGASELLIRVGRSPIIRINGGACAIEGPPLQAGDTEELMRSVTPEASIQRVFEQGSDELGCAFDGIGRFLVRVLREGGNFALVLRPTEPEKAGLNR